jgi:hypothetical protein
VTPLPGESLDSWLAVTASYLSVAVNDLCRALSLKSVLWPSRREVAAVVAATGLTTTVIEGMTLGGVYEGTALAFSPKMKRLDVTFPFGPLSRSRYCPECLAESEGRWQLSWRLGWSFACVRHCSLLLDYCPQCHSGQRRFYGGHGISPPGLCHCGCNLFRVNASRLPARSPIIDAQQLVFDVIRADRADFAVYAKDSKTAREALCDITDLANCVLTYAAIHGVTSFNQPDVLPQSTANWAPTLYPTERRLPRLKNSSPPTSAPASAAQTAVAVATALDILLAPNVIEATKRAQWFVEGMLVGDRKTTCQLWSSMRGSVSSTIVISASRVAMATTVPAVTQLRYRVWSPKPRRPDLDLRHAQVIAAALPYEMWPEWSARLLGATERPRESGCVRALLSYAVLLNGSTVSGRLLARLLGHRDVPNDSEPWAWLCLQIPGYWTQISQALDRLADYLLDSGAPIDYQRRRRLDYRGVLEDTAWAQICRSAGYRPADDREIGLARCRLIESLAAMPARLIRNASYTATELYIEQHIAVFEETIPLELDRCLQQQGQLVLEREGIEEPVLWCPPLQMIDDLDLPGPPSA